MKGFLCLKKISMACLLLCFCSLAYSLLSSDSANAVSVVSTGVIPSTNSSYIRRAKDGGSSGNLSSPSNIDNYYHFYDTYDTYFDATLIAYQLNSSIPANSIARLSVRYSFDSNSSSFERPYILSTGFLDVNATNASYAQVIDYNCYESDNPISRPIYTLSCDLTFYVKQESRNWLYAYTNLHAGNNTSYQVNVDISLSRLSYYTLDFDALSSDDKDWLTDDFAEAIAGAVAEGQKEADEEQKQQAETQASDSETEANTQGGDSSTQGRTLLQAFSSFVSAITNVQPDQSCDLDVDFSGYAPGLEATVDLCSISPPSGLTFIGSILLILFCVPLSISTVRRMVALFRSFQT